MKLQDYIDHVAEPVRFMLNNKIMMTITSCTMSLFYGLLDIVGTGFTAMAASLSISITFIVLYFALAFADLFFGIYANVFVLKEKFESKKFIKKFLLIGFGIIILYVSVSLINTFLVYDYHENKTLKMLLDTIVFMFEGIKISLVIFLILYELTSLREKAEKLQWNELIHLLDVFLIPFKKVQDFVSKRFEKTIEDENK